MQFASLKSYCRDHGWLLALYVLSSFGMAFPMVSIGSILNRELGVPSSSVILYYSLTYIPWNFRCLFGMFSDNCSLLGYRRRPYVFLTNIGVSICYIVYGQRVQSYSGACSVGVVLNVFFSFSEAVIDAMAVDAVSDRIDDGEYPNTSQKERATVSADIQSINMFVRTLGSMIAFLIAGRLSDSTKFPPRVIISMTAIFPFLKALIGLLLAKEVPAHARSPGRKDVFVRTRDNLLYCYHSIVECRAPSALLSTIRPVILPAVFILVYASCPNSNVGFMSFLYSDMRNLTESDFNILSQVETAGALFGTFLYWIMFRNTEKIHIVFVVSIVASAIATLSRLLVVNGWNSFWFIVLDGALVSIVTRVVLMPVQVYASIAASAPEHLMYEGFIFGFFASIENWGGTISGIIASNVIDHMTLSHFIIMCACISFLPLFLLSLLRPKDDTVQPKPDTDTTIVLV